MPWYDPRSWNGTAKDVVGGVLTGGGYPLGRRFWGEMSAKPEAPTSADLPYFEEDRARLGEMMGGQSPFAGSEWGSLIQQLQARASGQGPSLAGDAYRQASMDSQAALGSMGRNSGTAAGARQALMQQSRTGQGFAQGYANARNQEMVGAQGALTQALGARDQLNSGAFQNLLALQLGLSQHQMQGQLGSQANQLAYQQMLQQQAAAKWQAIAGLLAAGGKLAGSGGAGA